MNSKLTKGILMAAMLVQFAAPAFAFAEERKGSDTSRDDQTKFCSRIGSFGAHADELMYGREVSIKATRGKSKGTLESKWNERRDTLTHERDNREKNIDGHFAKIASRDLTDAQKSALATFKTEYERALATRKAAVDAALATYRTDAGSAINSRQSSIDSFVVKFKSAIKTAGEKAKADCASGIDPKIIRSDAVASMQAARDAFKSGMQTLDNRGDVLKPLIDARNAAIKSAMDVFKAAMENAKANLKAAFPEKQ